ncbi:MAG: pyridoxal-phosphate dependent enzyme [Flavobacteriaceae bacterium]
MKRPRLSRKLPLQNINEKGATFLHPSNDLDVILGNATATLELLGGLPHLEHRTNSCRWWWLNSTSAKHFQFIILAHPTCTTIGAIIEQAFRSLQSGKIETNTTSTTIADGLRTNLGDVNFPIIQELVNSIICVEEAEIIAAMKLIWERMKLIPSEPSSAVALAAVLKEKELFRNQHIGIIISGGNVDVKNLPF